MSTRQPLATSGVDNVHVHQSEKGNTATKMKEKSASDGRSAEREVNPFIKWFVNSADTNRFKL